MIAMTDIYDKFEKWLTEFQEDGYRAISKNAPSEIKEEAKKADDVYYNRTGRHLFHIDNE